ncbi:hypothetical protein RUM44_008326 [Polyplax serrata]|uniref:Peptidase S33 tripeptidyl aminopeptidase-like C-terminal domain-containing protein n=1 Tax=Polyplax serrata TaxID=468196 RepID=A0ABR1BC11_POLSC
MGGTGSPSTLPYIQGGQSARTASMVAVLHPGCVVIVLRRTDYVFPLSASCSNVGPHGFRIRVQGQGHSAVAE